MEAGGYLYIYFYPFKLILTAIENETLENDGICVR